MQYKKPVMRLKELEEMGFPREWLLAVYKNTPRKSIAWKISTSSNSPILFDTEAFEEYRKAQCTGE